MSEMSPELKSFYRAVLADLDRSWLSRVFIPRRWALNRRYGLCFNLDFYTDNNQSIRQEMLKQFFDAGLSVTFPFNDGRLSYVSEKNLYKNPKRLAWIKDHAA